MQYLLIGELCHLDVLVEQIAKYKEQFVQAVQEVCYLNLCLFTALFYFAGENLKIKTFFFSFKHFQRNPSQFNLMNGLNHVGLLLFAGFFKN